MKKIALLVFGMAFAADGQPAPNLGIFEGAGDVGSPSRKGSVTYDASRNEYRVTGGGNNMWAARDDFFFVWKKMTGDVAITANVKIVTGGNNHRKAALIVRKDLEHGSVYADAVVHGDGLTALQWREKADDVTRTIHFPLEGPTRLRFERRRNRIILYAGQEGGPLTKLGDTEMAQFNPVYAGLGVCAHDDKAETTAVFSDVTVEALPPLAPAAKPVPVAPPAARIKSGDPAVEWKRSKPDVVVYLPKEGGVNDGDNEHFLVFESPKGDLLAMWTQSSVEGRGDNHIMLARSRDGVKWEEPAKIVGPWRGESTPQASWGFPVVSRKGRIYCFFVQDAPQRDAAGRALKMSDMGTAYSDDDGRSWRRGADVPWPSVPEYDNPGGKSTSWTWIVWQKPIRDSKGRWIVGYSHWVSPEMRRDKPPGWWVADSGTKFLRFDNIDESPAPKDLKITHLMAKGKGLTIPSQLNPALTDCEEPSLVLLPDNRLFVTMRTITGYLYYSVSSDDGTTWRKPEPLRYRDGGDPIPHPKAPGPVYRMGDGRFLLLFFNNAGVLGPYSQYAPPELWKGLNHWSHIRRPAHLSLGEFRPKARQPIWFSAPRVLADTGGVIVGPKKTAEIATYTSYTEYKGKRTLWYPDRKYYLLGKFIDDDWLKEMPVPK